MPSARAAVIPTLAEQARRFPLMPALEPDVDELDPRDARLAVAIHRATLRRWLTLHHLLNRKLTQRLERMDPKLRAILLSAAAQLIFMERLPPHAVVDEAVTLTRRHLPKRPGMARLANAVLRRIAELAAPRESLPEWEPARDCLPTPDGALRLHEPALPDLDDLDRHLSVATSHPVELVRAWRNRLGEEALLPLLLHSLKQPPTILHDPATASPATSDAATASPAPTEPAASGSAGSGRIDGDQVEPHEQRGFYVFHGDHAGLLDHLGRHPDRWVQDPAAAAPVRATSHLQPSRIVDYCAGRGTKARQLAHLHPDATILATDPDPHRFEQLQHLAEREPRIRPVPLDRIQEHAGTADLLVLDVPCSNTGVLARRLEARYRYRKKTLDSLIELQRSILEAAAPLLNRHPEPPPHLLYSTCSLETDENAAQARWAKRHLEMRTVASESILPTGEGPTYHDGGYYALLTPA